MSCIEVIPVSQSEYPAEFLHDLFDRAGELEPSDGDGGVQAQTVGINPDCVLRWPQHTGLALDEQGGPVGFVYCWVRASRAEVLVRFERIYVMPAARGEGAGGMLLDWACDEVISRLSVKPRKVVLVTEVASSAGVFAHQAMLKRLTGRLAVRFQGFIPVLGEMEFAC